MVSFNYRVGLLATHHFYCWSHWYHSTPIRCKANWNRAYVLAGNVRVTVLDPDGGSFIDDLKEGDLWYFPAGFPHSLQGLGPNGTEFLLIFDDGRFSEESTFILTDWMGTSLLKKVHKYIHVCVR